MLIEENDHLAAVLTNIKHELHRATVDRKHPFRFVSLVSSGNPVAARFVVLRQIDSDLNLFIYTDHRSAKVRGIEASNAVQVLAYHPKKRAQVIISGEAQIHHQNELAKTHWRNVGGEGVKSYTSTLPPGTPIGIPEEAYDWNEASDRFFTVIRIVPIKIEALQLNQQQHRRVLFSRKHDWEGCWIAP